MCLCLLAKSRDLLGTALSTRALLLRYSPAALNVDKHDALTGQSSHRCCTLNFHRDKIESQD